MVMQIGDYPCILLADIFIYCIAEGVYYPTHLLKKYSLDTPIIEISDNVVNELICYFSDYDNVEIDF